MTDNQTQPSDDAESAATPESNSTPITDAGHGDGAATIHGSHTATRPEEADPAREEQHAGDTPLPPEPIVHQEHPTQSTRRPRRRAPGGGVESTATRSPDPTPGAALRPRRRPEAGAELATSGEASRKRVNRRQRAAPRPVPTRDFEQERVSPAVFVRQSVGELRKVVWPSGSQLGEYFVVVLAFVLFIIAFVGLLDLFFGWGLLKLLGK